MKRGSIELSFQTIFSMILMAAFIYAAFTGIKYFLETADQAKISSFSAELKSDVNAAWLKTEISQEYTYSLPSRIEKVCFADNFNLINFTECPDFKPYYQAYLNNNMFFCPAEKANAVSAAMSLKIDCAGKNCLEFPSKTYCINNKDGKVRIKLEKSFGAAKMKLS